MAEEIKTEQKPAEQKVSEPRVSEPKGESKAESGTDSRTESRGERGGSSFHRGGEAGGDFPRRRGPRRDGGRGRDSRGGEHEEDKEFSETLIKLNRVAKVLKGGRRFSFAALVVAGNKKGKVGFGFGKAGDVSEAIRKAIQNAKKRIIEVPLHKATIPHPVEGKFDSSTVLLKPAAPGTGIIAGGPVRIILEMAGYSDILSKCMGSRNSINVIKATLNGLAKLLTAQQVAAARGKSIKNFWG